MDEIQQCVAEAAKYYNQYLDPHCNGSGPSQLPHLTVWKVNSLPATKAMMAATAAVAAVVVVVVWELQLLLLLR
jgi:hypothetical protein